MKTPATSQVHRRAVLRGIGGVAVGMPMLDIFQPRRALAAPGSPFAVFVCATCGVAQAAGDETKELFWPTKTGPLTRRSLRADAKTRSVGVLADHADRLLVVRGIDHTFRFIGDTHNAGNALMLTGHPPSGDGRDVVATGESIDNRIAREKNPPGREPLALHAGMFAPGGTSKGLPGYCSYRAPHTPRAPDADPAAAYRRMVGLVESNPAVAREIAARRSSVNDLVRGQMKAFLGRTDLSKDDRYRLDTHFSAIRDIEVKLARALPARKVAAMKAVSGREYDNDMRQDIIKLHFDVLACALAADYTRAATLKIGDIQDRTQYTIDGVKLPILHFISHRVMSDSGDGGDIPDGFGVQAKVDRMFMGQFKYFLDQLRAFHTPYGPLIDQGFAAWTNHMGNGHMHTPTRLPWIIAGSARGALKTGQFLDVGSVKNVQLHNTLLYAAGVQKPDGAPVEDFSEASQPKGVVPGMLA